MLYEYQCKNGHTTEKLCNRLVEAVVCDCGEVATKIMSVCNNTFGFRLSDDSHDPVRRETIQGGKDKLVRNI